LYGLETPGHQESSPIQPPGAFSEDTAFEFDGQSSHQIQQDPTSTRVSVGDSLPTTTPFRHLGRYTGTEFTVPLDETGIRHTPRSEPVWSKRNRAVRRAALSNPSHSSGAIATGVYDDVTEPNVPHESSFASSAQDLENMLQRPSEYLPSEDDKRMEELRQRLLSCSGRLSAPSEPLDSMGIAALTSHGLQQPGSETPGEFSEVAFHLIPEDT
jgi:hypothetical protein